MSNSLQEGRFLGHDSTENDLKSGLPLRMEFLAVLKKLLTKIVDLFWKGAISNCCLLILSSKFMWHNDAMKSLWHENIFTIILSLTKLMDIIISFNVYGSLLLNSFHAIPFICLMSSDELYTPVLVHQLLKCWVVVKFRSRWLLLTNLKL